MKTLYDRLKPNLLVNLNSNEPQYAESVDRLIKLLMNNKFYSDLTVNEVEGIMTFCDVDTSYVSVFMYRFGEHLFINN